MSERNRFAKALWEWFRYALCKEDKVEFLPEYSDERVVDVIIRRQDGACATVRAYNMELGCFLY